MKKILFVNGNYNDIPLIKSAHKLGLYVITSGNDPHGEGHAYADEYCPCNYADKEAMLELAIEKKIDAVCSCGNDLGAITASYICEKLGLPGHDTFQNSKVFHEKDEFKKVVQKLSLPSPKSDLFSDMKEASKYIETAVFPKIIKPVDLGGGKGISVANNVREGLAAVSKAFEKSINKHIVIEDYITGSQHGFICFIKDRKVVIDYSSNDYSYLNPYMVWIASGYPADGYENVREQIIADVEKMAEYLNVADGFLTIQYIMCNGKPFYLETMRRCLGNLHFKCISKDIGINLYDLFVMNECGYDCSELIAGAHETGTKSGFMGIYADRNGILSDVRFDTDFEKYFFDRLMLHEPGYHITDYLGDKLGMVWFSFKSEEDRKSFMEKRNTLCSVIVK